MDRITHLNKSTLTVFGLQLSHYHLGLKKRAWIVVLIGTILRMQDYKKRIKKRG